MDNATRSRRSRDAVIEAALTIIARDGPARLTLDAIARESGISKGGLTHQFRSKEAVLKALVDRQSEYFEKFAADYRTETGTRHAQPRLAAQIATLREAITTPKSIVFAVIAAAAQEPGLLAAGRDTEARELEAVRAEAPDPDLAMLRWIAAWGLTLTAMLGLSAIGEADRERLFARLLEDDRWQPSAPTPDEPRKAEPRPRRPARPSGSV